MIRVSIKSFCTVLKFDTVIQYLERVQYCTYEKEKKKKRHEARIKLLGYIYYTQYIVRLLW